MLLPVALGASRRVAAERGGLELPLPGTDWVCSAPPVGWIADDWRGSGPCRGPGLLGGPVPQTVGDGAVRCVGGPGVCEVRVDVLQSLGRGWCFD